MTQDAIYWDDLFKESLGKYCCDLFIDANLLHYEGRIFETENNVCSIDITEYIRASTVLTVIEKVKFCLAWLHTIPIKNGSWTKYGVVFIDGKDFNYMHHTDFTSYLQLIGIIT